VAAGDQRPLKLRKFPLAEMCSGGGRMGRGGATPQLQRTSSRRSHLGQDVTRDLPAFPCKRDLVFLRHWNFAPLDERDLLGDKQRYGNTSKEGPRYATHQ